MRKSRKKVIASVLSVVLLIGCLAGCSSSSSDESDSSDTASETSETGEKKTITYYSWATGGEQDFFKGVIQEFEEQNPNIDINDQYVSYDEYLTKMNTLAAAGDLPEVFNLPENNVYEWGEKGSIADLTSMFENAGIDPYERFVDASMFYTDDHLWSVGYSVVCMSLLYNKSMLEEAGIEFPSSDPNEAWTWDEYVEAAKKLTKDSSGKTPNDEGFDKDDIVVYGTMMPSRYTSYIPLLNSNGSGITDESGTELLIAEEDGIEVIQKIADLSLKEYCAPTNAIAADAFSDSPTMLMNGQLGMYIDGAWAINEFLNEEEQFEDLGVAALPVFKTPANTAWCAGFCVKPEAVEDEDVFTFYSYLIESMNQVNAALNAGVSYTNLPADKALYENEEDKAKWISTYEPFVSTEEATEVCEAYESLVTDSSTVMAENLTLKNSSEIIETILKNELDQVWMGDKTAEEVLTSLDLSDKLQGRWK